MKFLPLGHSCSLLISFFFYKIEIKIKLKPSESILFDWCLIHFFRLAQIRKKINWYIRHAAGKKKSIIMFSIYLYLKASLLNPTNHLQWKVINTFLYISIETLSNLMLNCHYPLFIKGKHFPAKTCRWGGPAIDPKKSPLK